MPKKEFFEFLLVKEKEQECITEIDWEAKKNEWLSYLNGLYELFEKSLKDYAENGKIKIIYDKTQLIEENIGDYEAKIMTIKFAGEKITLKPIGTNLIGVKGRVDVIGKFGSAKIVLVDSRMNSIQDHIKTSIHDAKETPEEEILWEWKFVTSEKLYLPVNEDTIYSVIMELSNG